MRESEKVGSSSFLLFSLSHNISRSWVFAVVIMQNVMANDKLSMIVDKGSLHDKPWFTMMKQQDAPLLQQCLTMVQQLVSFVNDSLPWSIMY